MNKNNQVMKALSPEEMQELSNVKSLIEQIISMNSGQSGQLADTQMEQVNDAAISQPGAMKAAQEPAQNMDKSPEDEVEEPTGKPDEIKKAIENTPGDGPEGQDPAEERMEDVIPEGSEDALMEVAKALKAIFASKSVKKSAPVNPLVQVASAQTQAMKAMDDKINSVAKALETILDGFGITEQMKIAQKAAQPKQPIVSSDTNAVLKQLADMITANKVEKSDVPVYQSQGQTVRKNLSNPTLMSYLGMDADDNVIRG